MKFNDNNMKQAIAEAKEAFQNDEVPVGTIIIHNSKIIAKAHNLVQKEGNPLQHAEIIALNKATASLGTKVLADCDMYVTLEPCPMCAYAISLAKIRRLYFGAFDEKGGGVINGPQIYNSKSCHHKPEYYGGIMEDECGNLLKNYFLSKRKNKSPQKQ